MEKKQVAVLFGGQSTEHEVSCMSAVTVIKNLNLDYYEVTLIGITKEGHWLKVNSLEDIISKRWYESKVRAIISPDAKQKGILFLEQETVREKRIDAAIPVLHGKYGEDGTIQGLFELAGIPYVGCGVLASCICMDKFYTKLIVESLNIRQAKYVKVYQKDIKQFEKTAQRIETELGYPVFVKPSNAGSSIGVSKAVNCNQLYDSILLAAKYNNKVLVEEMIAGRELECAVLGGTEPRASLVGEILAAADFYDYDAKYNNEESRTVISPELPEGKAQEIMEKAVRIFEAVDGYGLARVDFFLEEESNEIVFNEINTLPGFTEISMYPMLWEAKGMSKAQLIEKLIQLAMRRAN